MTGWLHDWLKRQLDIIMDGWFYGNMDGWLHGWMVAGFLHRCMAVKMDDCMDELLHELVDG